MAIKDLFKSSGKALAEGSVRGRQTTVKLSFSAKGNETRFYQVTIPRGTPVEEVLTSMSVVIPGDARGVAYALKARDIETARRYFETRSSSTPLAVRLLDSQGFGGSGAVGGHHLPAVIEGSENLFLAVVTGPSAVPIRGKAYFNLTVF